MQAIVKIDGVQPSALSVLHGVVKQPYMHMPEQEIVPNVTTTRDEPTKVPYAKIMCSEFDPESETYTVTLILNLVIPNELFGAPDNLAPLSALVGLFKSIDPRLLPDEKAIDLEKARAAAKEALVEIIANEIINESSMFDITNSSTGEIIIPAGRKITLQLIKSLVQHFESLNVDRFHTDDHVIRTLCRIRLDLMSAQQK